MAYSWPQSEANIVVLARPIESVGRRPPATDTGRRPKGIENQYGGNKRQKRRSAKSSMPATRGPRMELGTTKPLMPKKAHTPMRPKSSVSAIVESQSPPEETVL